MIYSVKWVVEVSMSFYLQKILACFFKISRGDKITLTVDAIFRLFGSKISFQIEFNGINWW